MFSTGDGFGGDFVVIFAAKLLFPVLNKPPQFKTLLESKLGTNVLAVDVGRTLSSLISMSNNGAWSFFSMFLKL